MAAESKIRILVDPNEEAQQREAAQAEIQLKENPEPEIGPEENPEPENQPQENPSGKSLLFFLYLYQ